jgi:hypothetical protein
LGAVISTPQEWQTPASPHFSIIINFLPQAPTYLLTPQLKTKKAERQSRQHIIYDFCNLID